ncbi:MAG: dienelactone hydrolase family protein [Gammaproteobacteria bacterium]|nr:dienelactone hydrolase family protein [Gammaproteobacteria bacterium]
MGHRIELRAADGFELGAWESTPSGTPKGGVVVIQEIFGVNGHIREVVDGYAEAGYAAVAPQIFDRAEPNVELGYEEADMGRGIELAFQKLQMPNTLADIQAAIDHASAHGRVGVVGYCFGGLLTWLSACELTGVAAASSYYGGGVAGEAERSPKCPVIMHFGELDAHIPLSDVDKVKAAQPDVPVYVYAADHGFNCDHRASYDAPSADLARQRTLAFFQEHLG